MAITQPIKAASITRQGQEQFVCQELNDRLVSIESKQITSQTVEISAPSVEALASLPLFFSAQLLPSYKKIHAPSIKAWTTAAFEHLVSQVPETIPEWCLHVYDVASAESGRGYSRPQLIERELVALLKQKRRSLHRALVPTCTQSCTLFQLALTSPNDGYMSVASTELRLKLGAMISPHWAGYVRIADDKRPPSRAFKKLVEAIDVFGLPIHKGCSAVDLGASPGGWTHVLESRGASVVAVDRSPLEGPISKSPRVTFVQGNAFTWTPKSPVDWLVCDVITTPDRTFHILKTWIEKRLCKNLCVTIKFKGAPDTKALNEISAYLKEALSWFDGRQLTHNKNEVTVVGRI